MVNILNLWKKNCILNFLRNYIFLVTPDEVEKYAKMMQSNSSDNCVHHYNIKVLNIFALELQLINTKPAIKNKLKELLNELKTLKVQSILVWEYKKRNDCKIFHSSAKLIASDSYFDEAFKSMHQSIITKIKKNLSKDWIIVTIENTMLMFLSVSISTEKWRYK